MTASLVAVVEDRVMGELTRGRGGKLTFSYASDWQDDLSAFPLSWSMPLARAKHDTPVEPFLWNLLPDNELILERWARRFQVSARDGFALLEHVGEDCAGAVRFLTPARVERRSGSGGTVRWLDEAEVAERLRALRTDISAWRRLDDAGQFSLAGAQPKTALLYRGGRFGVPSGHLPTTHILKPGVLDLDGQEANEHFCLTLARSLGLPAATSSVARFEDQTAIIVERYDRIRERGKILRVHQEDLCQALGVSPARKYQSDGGPSARDLFELIQTASSAPQQDAPDFIRALLFSWIIGGTDAHAKNYSMLIGTRGTFRLAPLYDLISALPYSSMSFQKLKLAMKVGSTYRLRDIGRYQWEKQATLLKIDEDELLAWIRTLLEATPDAASTVLANCRSAGLRHRVLARLAKAITQRAKGARREFGF